MTRVFTTAKGAVTAWAVSTAALPSAAAEWIVDEQASRIGFQATQMGAPFRGEFHDYEATIAFDPDDPDSGSALVTVTVASLDTGNDERDAAALGPLWFDAATYSTATFASDGFTALDDNHYRADGRLSMRGVTHVAAFTFALDIAEEGNRRVAHVSGVLPVSRSDFGIGRGEWASDGVIGDRVTIEIELTAKAAR